jgi:hypothetical protein
MLLLTSTSDKVQVITGSAGTVKVHGSWVDNASGTITPGRTNTASITTATTTDVVGAPAASTQRNIKHLSVRNTDASVSNAITVQHTDGTTVEEQWKGTLLPGEAVILDQNGVYTVYTANGVIKSSAIGTIIWNQSVSTPAAGFASDTYLVGSSINIPSQGPKVGTKYRCKFDVSKTAAGTATAVVTLRYGTAGTTSDTARLTFTFTAGTAAADLGTFEIEAVFRTVGSGTNAVLQGRATITHQLSATTGIVNLVAPTLQVTSGGFDSTVAASIIGISVNGGASAAWTIAMVDTTLENI